jgi:hypothetical protein
MKETGKVIAPAANVSLNVTATNSLDLNDIRALIGKQSAS